MSKEKVDVKTRTIELYDMLPQDNVEARKARLDIRDEIFELNYKFFGYVASHPCAENLNDKYEDKFQSACRAFLEIWWKYRYAAKYRMDIAFGVFFFQRLREMVRRELSEVKYGVKRALCMEVAKILNKPWPEVGYHDLEGIDLDPQKVQALQAILGTPYKADLDTHAIYICDENTNISIDNTMDEIGDKYDDLETFLIKEMLECESKLNDAKLRKYADIYAVDFYELKRAREVAEKRLYNQLNETIVLRETFIDKSYSGV